MEDGDVCRRRDGRMHDVEAPIRGVGVRADAELRAGPIVDVRRARCGREDSLWSYQDANAKRRERRMRGGNTTVRAAAAGARRRRAIAAGAARVWRNGAPVRPARSAGTDDAAGAARPPDAAHTARARVVVVRVADDAHGIQATAAHGDAAYQRV